MHLIAVKHPELRPLVSASNFLDVSSGHPDQDARVGRVPGGATAVCGCSRLREPGTTAASSATDCTDYPEGA